MTPQQDVCGLTEKKKHLQQKNSISSHYWRAIQTMYIPRMSCSVKSGTWNRSETLRPLQYISKKSAKRSSTTHPSHSILKPSGELDTALKYSELFLNFWGRVPMQRNTSPKSCRLPEIRGKRGLTGCFDYNTLKADNKIFINFRLNN